MRRPLFAIPLFAIPVFAVLLLAACSSADEPVAAPSPGASAVASAEASKNRRNCR